MKHLIIVSILCKNNIRQQYVTSNNCIHTLQEQYKTTWKCKFEQSKDDVDSRLETYYRIKPSLSVPKIPFMIGNNRVLLTRLRSGSHSLRIELGRYARPFITRENGTCKCNYGIQTVLHCFTECPLVLPHLPKTYTNLQSKANDDDICNNILLVYKILKVPF